MTWSMMLSLIEVEVVPMPNVYKVTCRIRQLARRSDSTR